MAESNYDNLSYRELQDLCKEREINAKGSGDELKERLIAADAGEQGEGERPEYVAPPKKEKPVISAPKAEHAQYIAVRGTRLKLIRKRSYFKRYEDGTAERINGDYVQFDNGIFETNDPETIEFLENHPNNRKNPGGSPEFFRVEKVVSQSQLMQQFAEQSKSLEEKDAELEALRAENLRLKMKEKGQEVVDDSNRQQVTEGVRSSSDVKNF